MTAGLLHQAWAELLDALASAGAVPIPEHVVRELLTRAPQLKGLVVGLSLDAVPLAVRRGRPPGGGHRRWRVDVFGLRKVHSLKRVARPTVEQIRELVAKAAAEDAEYARGLWRHLADSAEAP